MPLTYADLDAELNGRLVALRSEFFRTISTIVQAGPIPPLTDVQKMQLEVAVSEITRRAAEYSRRHWEERKFALPPPPRPPPPTMIVTPQAPPGPDPAWLEDATTKPMPKRPR